MTTPKNAQTLSNKTPIDKGPSLAHAKVPTQKDAVVAKGSYEPLPTETNLGPVPRYLSEHLVINGCSLITPSSPDLRPEEASHLQNYILATGTGAVVIADTVLTRSMLGLIKSLARSGIKVSFIDHHNENSRTPTDRQRAIADSIQELRSTPNVTVTFATREEIPTCSLLVNDGQFTRERVGVFIGAPFDFDVAGAFFKGTGLRWDTVKGWNKHSLELDCAILDSRGPRAHPQLVQEMNIAKTQALGESVTRPPFLDFLAKSISVAQFSRATGLGLTDLSTVDVLAKFALSIQDGLGAMSSAWRSLGPVGKVEKELLHVLQTLARKHAFIDDDAPIVNVDLSSNFKSFDKEFPNDPTVQRIARAMTGPDSFRAPRWMLKAIAQDLHNEARFGERTQDGSALVYTYTTDRNELALFIVPTGTYRRDRFGNGIDFRSLNTNGERPLFSTFLGETATVYCGPAGADESYAREDAARAALAQALKEAGSRERREPRNFRPRKLG